MNRKQRRAEKKPGPDKTALQGASRVQEVFADAFRHHQAGRLNEAERHYRQVLAIDPRHAASLHLLGTIAHQMRRHDAAADLIHRAIAIDAKMASYHSSLGNVLEDQGKPDGAAACYRRALGLRPDSPEAHYNLGNALRDQGKLDEAVAHYRAALRLQPNSPEAHNNLGLVLQSQGHSDEAVLCYRKALDLKPDYARAHYNLGNALKDLGRLDEAAASYGKALVLKPDYPQAHYNLGLVRQDQGRLDEAVVCYRRALDFKPDYAMAHNNLGIALKEQGRFEEAIAAHETAIRLGIDLGRSYFGLSHCRKFTQADLPLIAKMRAALEDPEFSDADRALFHFALGKIFDDLADYEAAIRHFDEANRLKRAAHPFDAPNFTASVDRSIGAFPKEGGRAALASDSELPILIVGMPRSGTTLTEQILASHPKVAAGGELDFWLRRADGMRNQAADRGDAAAEQDAIRDYLALLTHISPAAPARVTDKMPSNFLHLGLVHRLFPKARIIHCRRNPVDTALSIYFTHFARTHEFANSRHGIVLYYRQYRRLMEHWRTVLPPDRFIEIDYESLVADQNAVSRRLIAFCGLDWDDACLDFHNTRRWIGTASAWQARQPLYRSSVERWRHYQPWLGEFGDLLPQSRSGEHVGAWT